MKQISSDLFKEWCHSAEKSSIGEGIQVEDIAAVENIAELLYWSTTAQIRTSNIYSAEYYALELELKLYYISNYPLNPSAGAFLTFHDAVQVQ
jgi:hypothetical protein